MFKIKQIPEDFIVREISNINVKDSGKYLYYKLTKKNYNTIDVISKIAKRLRIKEKKIGFAGSKDKNAVTEQVISFFMINKDNIDKIKIKDIKLEFIGYGDEPITLGDLQGNKFEIIVRNLDEKKLENINKEINLTVNYFDEQRFSKNNVAIGRYLVKKNFKEAAKLIDDEKVIKFLRNNKTNYVGSLQKLSKRILRFYVHAYQSFLWNEIVKRYLEKKFKVVKKVNYSQGEFVFVDSYKDIKLPLIGWGVEIENNESLEIVKKVMSEEKIDYKDFIIKQFPEISEEGELRDVFVEIKNLKINEFTEDELNLTKKKVKINFSLPKGSYATIIIKSIFG